MWQRPDKRYSAAVTVQTAHGPKRVTTTKRRRKDADAWLTRMKAERDGGRLASLNTERLTVADYLREWLETVARPTVAPGTYDRYRIAVQSQLVPAFGSLALSETRPPHVRAAVGEMVSKGYAPATIRHVFGVFRAAMNAAVADDLIPKSPAKNVKLPPARTRMRALTREEAGRLLAVVRRDAPRRDALYTLALRTGLREGELCGLRWEDVDLETGSVTVARSVDTRYAGNRFSPTKTSETRKVELSPDTAARLEAHRKLQLEERIAARVWEMPEIVFANRRGGVTRRTSLIRDFHRDLDAAGLLRIRFHDLRHTSATLMLTDGMPVHTVARILGHADPSMTLKRYAHCLPGTEREAARRMDDILP